MSDKFSMGDEISAVNANRMYTGNHIEGLNAGATINGATLPVPVYQNTSDNEVYACDANDTSKLNFIGFAISNSTDGNPIDVQCNGIVKGFTGLTEGVKYFIQDTVGTIGTSAGTYQVLAGKALSETELLITDKEKCVKGTGSFSVATNGGTDNNTYTVGFRIKQLFVVSSIKIVGLNDCSFYGSSSGMGLSNGNQQSNGSSDTYSSNSPMKRYHTYSSSKIAIFTGFDGSYTSSGSITLQNITDTGFDLQFTASNGWVVDKTHTANCSFIAIG